MDCTDGTSLCAVSVRQPQRGDQRPKVVSAIEVSSEVGAGDTDALRELMAQTARGLPVVVTLSRSQYTLRVMPEPVVPARDMANSLRWSIGADSDTPGDDINVAWMRIPTEDDLPQRMRQLYAITTPTRALTEQLAAWKPAGLKPRAVDIRETALRNLAAAAEIPGEGLALIASDPHGVGMVFTHHGSLYLDRYLPQTAAEVAMADSAGRERLYDRILQQLLRSVDIVNRSYPFMPITRVVVAPMPDRPGLATWMADRVPFEVVPLELTHLFDLDAVPMLAESPAFQARCLVPLGAALRNVRAVA